MQPSSPARQRSSGLLALVLLLGVSPLLVGTVVEMRERRAPRAQVELLERVPFMITAWERGSCEPVAAREGVIIAHLDMQGGTIFRTGSVPLAGGSTGQTLDQADAQLPPWPARAEVRAALVGNRTFGRYATPDDSAQVVTLAQPRPEGGALYIVAGSLGGTSRRAFVRKVVLIDAVVTLAIVALVIVWRRRRRENARP